MTKITDKRDPLLTVYINRDDAAARVYFVYDDGPDQSTPYQTADMPMDDAEAWQMVNEYAEAM